MTDTGIDDVQSLARWSGLAAGEQCVGEAARGHSQINAWTAERTHDRIQELLPERSVDDALLVLVNAIYFKASWLNAFDAEKTRRQVFHGRNGDTMVQMMHGPGGRYAVGDGYKATELQYITPSVSLFVVVPDAGRFGAVLHQAFVAVNETGAEAAAATAVIAVPVSAPAPRKSVALIIDRPFLFAI